MPAGTLAPSTPQLPPCLPQPLVELGDPGAGVMAASVLSTGMSFCAPPAESFSLAGHEKAFIPSPPRGRITPGRTLCCRLALGPPVTPVRVGAWHSPAGAFRGDPEQTAASLGPHKPYLLLSRLWTDRCPPGERRDMAVAASLFSAQLFISLNKDATVMWAKRRPRSSPAPQSPAPQPSAALLLRPWERAWSPRGSPSQVRTCNGLLGISGLNGRPPWALQTPQRCPTFPSTAPCHGPASAPLNINRPPQLQLGPGPGVPGRFGWGSGPAPGPGGFWGIGQPSPAVLRCWHHRVSPWRLWELLVLPPFPKGSWEVVAWDAELPVGSRTLGLRELTEGSSRPGDPQVPWEYPLWAGRSSRSPCEQGSPSRVGPWHRPKG